VQLKVIAVPIAAVMTMAKSNDDRRGRDAQSSSSPLSIEDTAAVRGRLERGKRGPSAFDPYA